MKMKHKEIKKYVKIIGYFLRILSEIEEIINKQKKKTYTSNQDFLKV